VQAGLKIREWVNIAFHFFLVLAIVANMGLRQPLTQLLVIVLVLLCYLTLAVVLCGHSDSSISEAQRRSTYESRKSLIVRASQKISQPEETPVVEPKKETEDVTEVAGLRV
jgi:hypothetical protein